MLKKTQKSFKSKQAHVQLQSLIVTKVGMTPQSFDTIPTPCAIISITQGCLFDMGGQNLQFRYLLLGVFFFMISLVLLSIILCTKEF